MQIVIKADAPQKEAILSKGIPADVMATWLAGEKTIPTADVYFDLLFEEEGSAFASITDKPVLVNAVIKTCSDLPANYIRFNGWNSFLQREIIEMAGATTEMIATASGILNEMQWKYQVVADIPGMISARVIAMIINEAYFGLGDEISTKKEIDTAMKLGTNYPYGPFQWGEKIGLHKIYALLQTLYKQDKRYAVAPELEKEITLPTSKPINK